MTKKDFELIAGVIRSRLETKWPDDTNLRDIALVSATLSSIGFVLASKFDKVYPRFDKDKFLRECGLKK